MGAAMSRKQATLEDISAAIGMLTDLQRSISHIEQTAIEISIATNGEVNSQAEAISGTAAIAAAFARSIQVRLGDYA
jgi:hypothetical protein